MSKETKVFKLVDLPDYEYPINVACPTCYRPLYSLKRVDGRCDLCLRNKEVLHVNWIRPPKKKSDEDREEEKARRRWTRDED